jgi:hypothetical protein
MYVQQGEYGKNQPFASRILPISGLLPHVFPPSVDTKIIDPATTTFSFYFSTVSK